MIPIIEFRGDDPSGALEMEIPSVAIISHYALQ
jgi:hypothetical protein